MWVGYEWGMAWYGRGIWVGYGHDMWVRYGWGMGGVWVGYAGC